MRQLLIVCGFLLGLFVFGESEGNGKLPNYQLTAGAPDALTAPERLMRSTALFSTFPGIQASPFTISSQHFTDAGIDFASQGADDFFIIDNAWIIDTVEVRGSYFGGSGPAESVNVYILGNSGGFGGLPDTTNLSAGAIYAAENLSPHIAPVSRRLALCRCGWTQVWTEGHSCSYGPKEDQIQAQLNKPGPG